MLTRIIVAVIAIPVLVVLIFFAPVWALGIVVGGIAAVSAWEFLRCTSRDAGPRISAYAAVAGFSYPFLSVFYNSARVFEIAVFCLFVAVMVELMLSFRREKTMQLDTVALTLVAGGVFPLLLTGIIHLAVRRNGAVYALLPFVACFSSDSGAYFAGVFLGRHKLAPRISPNKTIEGSAGGFLLAIGLMLVYGLILQAAGFQVNYTVMGVYGFLGALAGQAGDLGFSAIKRLCGVKDYGKLIPGHGGMLDRFDSMIWTAPLLDLVVRWVPAITR